MSWRIAADLREIFADIVVTDDKKMYLIRTRNRRDQLHSGLVEALTLLPADVAEDIKSRDDTSVFLRTDFERIAVKDYWGGPMAFVTTAGFESMIEIGDQRRLHTFGLHAEKQKSLVGPELSFGLTERTRADGTIATQLNPDEITNLILKLELAEIKTVALCFLHSLKNAQNEKEVARVLREKGFDVFLSHTHSGDEQVRAKKVCAQAFSAGGLKQLKTLSGLNPQHIFINEGPSKMQSPESKNALVIDFFESRFEMTQADGKYQELNFSPLLKTDLDFVEHVHVGPDRIEAEPGPVALGKGIHLCVFDLFAYKTQFNTVIPRLKADPQRLAKFISPLAKQLRQTAETITDHFISLCHDLLSLEVQRSLLNHVPPLLIARGPLAPVFGATLARRLGIRKIQFPPYAAFSTALEMLEGPKPTDVEILGDLKFSTPLLSEGEIHEL